MEQTKSRVSIVLEIINDSANPVTVPEIQIRFREKTKIPVPMPSLRSILVELIQTGLVQSPLRGLYASLSWEAKEFKRASGKDVKSWIKKYLEDKAGISFTGKMLARQFHEQEGQKLERFWFDQALVDLANEGFLDCHGTYFIYHGKKKP